MSHPLYNSQTITEYLLGTLNEADAARLDELSITDDEFSDALNVAEKDLIDAYVQGELSGSTLEQFKSHYLASSLRREKVQFAQTLQSFAVVPERKAGFSRLAAFPRPIWQWGIVLAGCVLFIATGLLLFQNMRLQQQMTRAQADSNALQQRERQLQNELETQRTASVETEQELTRIRQERARLEEELNTRQLSTAGAIASFVLTPQLRGTEQLTTIRIPAATARIAMRLPLEPNDFSTYRVALIDLLTNETVWQSATLKAADNEDSKSLSVNFSAALLKPQNYILRVTGAPAKDGTGVLSDYAFRVAK